MLSGLIYDISLVEPNERRESDSHLDALLRSHGDILNPGLIA